MPSASASPGYVYCFGHITTGQILRLAGSYPAANGYAEVVERAENYCGEATGTALTLQRFGIPTMLAGNWIGDDDPGRRTLAFLQAQGIDCSALRIAPGFVGANEVVVTDATSRTVFGRFIDLLTTTPQWDPPRQADLAGARWACIDPSFGATSRDLADRCRALGIPFVTSDSALESPLTTAAAATVISAEWLSGQPELGSPLEAFGRYLAACPGLVVFTDGAGPVWWGRGAVRGELSAYAIEAVDTAGAGDSFRAGILYGLYQEWDDARTVRFANALAALNCLSFPGVVNGPTLEAVEVWLEAAPAHPPAQ